MIRALAIISKACNLTYESTDYILGTFGSQCRAGHHYWIKKRATQEEIFIGKHQLIYLQNPIILVREETTPGFKIGQKR